MRIGLWYPAIYLIDRQYYPADQPTTASSSPGLHELTESQIEQVNPIGVMERRMAAKTDETSHTALLHQPKNFPHHACVGADPLLLNSSTSPLNTNEDRTLSRSVSVRLSIKPTKLGISRFIDTRDSRSSTYHLTSKNANIWSGSSL